MVDWRDDQNRFFDRSLGAITNGITTDNPLDPPSALIHAELGADSLNATYNAAGDMASLSVRRAGDTRLSTFEWDVVHRLARATVGGVVSSFTYDSSDTRRVKESLGDTVYYPMDDFEVRNGVATKWIFVGSRRVMRVSDASTWFYVTNHLGTTSTVFAANGAPVSWSTYLPYGALESEVTSVANADPDYRFTGKERDDQTGLDYFGARYYAANLGQWISPDPLQTFAPSPGVSEGSFAYGARSPIVFNDPSGMEFEATVGTEEFRPSTALSGEPALELPLNTDDAEVTHQLTRIIQSHAATAEERGWVEITGRNLTLTGSGKQQVAAAQAAVATHTSTLAQDLVAAIASNDIYRVFPIPVFSYDPAHPWVSREFAAATGPAGELRLTYSRSATYGVHSTIELGQPLPNGDVWLGRIQTTTAPGQRTEHQIYYATQAHNLAPSDAAGLRWAHFQAVPSPRAVAVDIGGTITHEISAHGVEGLPETSGRLQLLEGGGRTNYAAANPPPGASNAP